MKNYIKSLLVVSLGLLFITSCEKDEGNLPTISFKTGGSYTSSNCTMDTGSSLTIGINASKAEPKDVLKKIDISTSINGATATSVYSKDLTGSEGDIYTYDYATTLGATPGQTCKYTFTITNRDGLVNQVSLTVTAQ